MLKVRIVGLGKRFGFGLVENVKLRLGQLRTMKPRYGVRGRFRRDARDEVDEREAS